MKRILFVFTILTIGLSQAWSQCTSTPVVVPLISLAGQDSNEGQGDPANVVVTPVVPAGVVTDLDITTGIDLTTAGNGSWCSEATIDFNGVLFLNPSAQASPSPCNDLPFGPMAFDLVGLGFDFSSADAVVAATCPDENGVGGPVGGNGTLRIELFESFNDGAGPDATYDAGEIEATICPLEVLTLEVSNAVCGRPTGEISVTAQGFGTLGLTATDVGNPANTFSTDLDGAGSGTVSGLDPGMYDVIVNDGPANGGTTMIMCDVAVEIIQGGLFENHTDGSSACIANVNLTLDAETCTTELSPTMVLSSELFDECIPDVYVHIVGITTPDGMNATIPGPGSYTYEVYGPEGILCWGNLVAEDKTPPTIDCNCQGPAMVNSLSGTLTGLDPLFARPDQFAQGGTCTSTAIADHIYEAVPFLVSATGSYSFAGQPYGGVNLSAAIYMGSFDPLQPCLNNIATLADVNGPLVVNLTAGVQYVLVAFDFQSNTPGAGDWTYDVTSPDGSLLLDDPACQFPCYELDAVLDNGFVNRPTMSDACGPVSSTFSDIVNRNDCGTSTITRTWLVTDAVGMTASCTQVFSFNTIATSDVLLPPAVVTMPCGTGTSPEEVEAFFDIDSRFGAGIGRFNDDYAETPGVEEFNEGNPFAWPHYFATGIGGIHAQAIDNKACNILASWSDQNLAACGADCPDGGVKIIRTWSIVDWCEGTTTPFVQIVETKDTEAPIIAEWTGNDVFSVDPWGCTYSGDLPVPWIHDNCTEDTRYEVRGPVGTTVGDFDGDGVWEIINAPKGVITLNYTVFDCCGNSRDYTYDITVFDGVEPVVQVTQIINISLTSSGTADGQDEGIAKLYASSVGQASYDHCTDVKIEIRRESAACDYTGNGTYNADAHSNDGSSNPSSPAFDPDNGEFVKFCCEDATSAVVDIDGDGVNDTGYVKVWIRVWDDANMDGIEGTPGPIQLDNYGEGWFYVKVEDKSAPTIQCPEDMTLNCDMDYSVEATGEAIAFGNCGTAAVSLVSEIVNETCGVGTIRRTWAVDGFPSIRCTQTITLINPNGPFDGDNPAMLRWPRHHDGSPGNLPALTPPACDGNLETPTIVQGPCDQVVESLVDVDTFMFEEGACMKILRYWEVLDWCQYVPNATPEVGIWRYTQVVKVIDTDKPEMQGCTDPMFEVDGDCINNSVTLTNSATDAGGCGDAVWLKWQVLVDTWGDGVYDWEYSSFLPTFDAAPNGFNSDNNGNGIPDVYVSATASGEEISIVIPEEIESSMINHKVLWKVTDGCGNITQCETTFMVVDKKAPTPYCIDLGTAPMPSTGSVEIWAIDFDNGALDNCTPQDRLRFTFDDINPDDITDGTYLVDKRSQSKVFTTADCGLQIVDIYVWDEKGNRDFCTMTLSVSGEGCPTSGSRVNGSVITEDAKPVREMEIALEHMITSVELNDMTDVDGGYDFDQNVTSGDHKISGVKNENYVDGVSTLDLLAIQKHILGIAPLQTPYQMIAADINANDEVRSSDLNELRKLILGIYDELPNNESWILVSESDDISVDNWNEYIKEHYIMGLSSNMEENFIGVKVGDVNNTYTASVAGETTTSRSANAIEMVVEAQQVTAGNEVSIDLRSNNFADVHGYQFTMMNAGLELVSVESGAIEMTSDNVATLTSDMTTMSWMSIAGETVNSDDVLFTLVFRATESGNIANMLDITSTKTAAEAYVSSANTVVGVGLEVRGDVTAEFALYQNEPNPFAGETQIGFMLPEAGTATLTVYDVTGKVVASVRGDYASGYNAVTLSKEDLSGTGVMYYELVSGTYTATKKMIVIE